MEQLTWVDKNNTLPETDIRRQWRAVDILELKTKFNANVNELPSVIQDAIDALIGGAPGSLDTLNELAAALADDASFSTAVTSALAGKQPTLASGTNIKTIQGNSIVGPGNVTLIEEAIEDGVTDKATSQNKLFAELALKASVQYVDDVASGLVSFWKEAVIVATTTNITLSGEQTLDGVLTSASRALVKNQNIPSQNGIYVTAAGAWARSTDADADDELEGVAVTVQQGTTQTNTSWIQTTEDVTLGSSAIVWNQLGTSVQDASPTNKGVARLYAVTGANTDGSMDQNSITNALAGKAAVIDAMPFGATTGTNTYAAVMSPTVTAYTNGRLYHIRVGITNNAVVTLNLDGVGAKKVFRTDGVQLGTGHLLAGVDYLLSYNSALDGGVGGFVAVNELQHGFMNTRGQWSGNSYPSAGGSGVAGAIRQGDTFVMSTTNTLSAGVVVNVGDMVFTIVDAPGQSAPLWFVIPGRQSLALKPDLTSFIYGEVPSGTVDGVNDDFVIANSDPSKVALYLDGIRTNPTNFSITGTALTITNATVIPTNSILIDYIK